MFESTTFPDNLYESIVVLIFGTLMAAADWLPLMAVLGLVRWLLAKVLGFERRQRVHGLMSGFTTPAWMIFLVFFFELQVEFTGIGIPARTGQLLALGGDVWFTRKRLSQVSTKARWSFLVGSLLALLAILVWGTALGIDL